MKITKMRRLLVLIPLSFFFFACGNSNRILPKRYFGKYQGIQEAYSFEMNGGKVTIPKEKFELTLGNKVLFLEMGENTIKATYKMKVETKMYYSLQVALENGRVEEWRLWKKKRKLIRKPIPPQPTTIFLQE